MNEKNFGYILYDEKDDISYMTLYSDNRKTKISNKIS